ncbi:MAG: Na+/H+ antiporter [Solitalea-like symbiont of Tyrophagus putrescentiae]
MENYTVILSLLAVIILISAVAEKINLSSPILLICSGLCIGFIPWLPSVEINDEIIFLIFLPPLLYHAAFNISFQGFRQHINVIGSLAIGLVFLTAGAIGILTYLIIPGMSWPVAFLLGAMLAATDAVSAISITKNLGLSRNTIVILEGESLINDASALVLFQFAISAVIGISVVWWQAIGTFIVLLIGGFLVGLVIGRLTRYILKFIHNNRMPVVSFMLITPFVTYLVAESLHCSGVIAVVVLGFVSKVNVQTLPKESQKQLKTILDTTVFTLDGLVFLLIGLALPIAIESIDKHLIIPYIGYSFLVAIVAIVVRMIMIFVQRQRLQISYKNPFLQRTKMTIKSSVILSFKESLIIGWSGIRGIISLAMAISIPQIIGTGKLFPMRDDLIFITIMVVLITILGQGLLLPFLVRNVKGQKEREIVTTE